MKATRRHELKTNELADYISHMWQYLRHHSTKVLVFGALVAVLAFALFLRVQTHARNMTSGWKAYFEAARVVPDENDADWLDDSIRQWETIIATYDEPRLRSDATWALVGFTRQQAIAASVPDEKQRLLDIAEQNCLSILERNRSQVTLYGAALIELAAIEQDRFTLDHDLRHREKARAYLQRVLDEDTFQGSPLRSEVRRRLDDFDQLWTVVELSKAAPQEPDEETSDLEEEQVMDAPQDAPSEAERAVEDESTEDMGTVEDQASEPEDDASDEDQQPTEP